MKPIIHLPRLVAVATAAVLVMAAPAAAQDAKPEPMPCVGLSSADKAGDVTQLSPAPTIPPSMDLKGFFFRYAAGADGKKVLTANIQVDDLVEEPYSDVAGIEWEIQYTIDDFVYVAGAQVAPSGTTYYNGSWFLGATGPPPEFYGLPEETTGRFIPGKDGIIEIVIPSEGLEKKNLIDLWSRTRLVYNWTVPHQGNGSAALDRAPEGDAFGKPFTVDACPEAPPAPPAGQPPAGQPPASTPPPSQQPSSQQPSSQQQTQTPAKSRSRSVAAKKKACRKKAKKIKNKRKRAKALKRCKRIKR